jgi:hypothetical protein
MRQVARITATVTAICAFALMASSGSSFLVCAAVSAGVFIGSSYAVAFAVFVLLVIIASWRGCLMLTGIGLTLYLFFLGIRRFGGL